MTAEINKSKAHERKSSEAIMEIKTKLTLCDRKYDTVHRFFSLVLSKKKKSNKKNKGHNYDYGFSGDNG